jgi:lipoprotein-releasing system permease protein
MLKLILWLKYLRRRRVVLLSMAAVALSVALLTVVSSLFTGFISAFERSAEDLIGDVLLENPEKFPQYPKLITELERTGFVEAAAPTVRAPGLLRVGMGNVRAVSVWGIDPARMARVTTLKTSLLRQRDLPEAPSFDGVDPNGGMGGFVGIGVLAEPNQTTDKYDLQAVRTQIGRGVVLITGSLEPGDPNDASERRPKRLTVPFVIADVVSTGNFIFDQDSVFLPLEGLFAELYPGQAVAVDHIHIKLRPGVDVQAAKAGIMRVWQDFAQRTLGWDSLSIARAEVVTARELQARYLEAIRKQRGVLQLIFGVVDCGAVLLVLCIFYMIVRLKQKDIAILKSCGYSSGQVAWVFLGFGAVVGLAGSAWGTLLGCLFTRNINAIEDWLSVRLGLKLWDSSVYFFERIPDQVDWPSVVRIALLATIAACIGAVVPAILAARTRPVEILRYD